MEVFCTSSILGNSVHCCDLDGDAMSRSSFQVLVFLCRHQDGQDEVLLLSEQILAHGKALLAEARDKKRL